jgi:hypothetical protein
MEAAMSEHAKTPDVGDSRAALESVDQAKLAVVAAARTPVWLTALGTGLLAVILLGNWLMEESRSREAVTGLATVAFLGLWGVNIFILNRRGLKIGVIPSSSAGRWFLLGYSAFVLAVFLLTGWLLEQGQSWVAWVSTTLICATFVIQVRRFPTGEPIVPAASR